MVGWLNEDDEYIHTHTEVPMANSNLDIIIYINVNNFLNPQYVREVCVTISVRVHTHTIRFCFYFCLSILNIEY